VCSALASQGAFNVAGQIINRGKNRWLVRVPRGRDGAGTRLYHNRTVYGSKKEAEAYLTKVLREVQTGTFVEASSRSIADFVSDWLDTTASQRVRPRTLSDYRWLAERYIFPDLGGRTLSQVHASDIQRAYAALTARGLSPRTVRYAHSVLHGALEHAVRWQALARNPAKLVTLPRAERREMNALDADQSRTFLRAAREDRWFALWLLLISGGMRPGEALGLKWSDVDGNRLRIQRSLVRASNHSWSLTEPKTARARRTVVLPAIALQALVELQDRQAVERATAGYGWTEHGLIFTTGTGTPLDYRVLVRRHFKKLLTQAKLPIIRPYDLRHTSATLLLGAGENVKVVSERLGHTSAALTLDVYSHVLPHMQHDAAERLGHLLLDPAAA
jgi:integrase